MTYYPSVGTDGAQPTGVHQAFDFCQPRTKFAAGVKDAEMFGRKVAVFHQGDRQCIAKRQCHSGRRGGHNALITGFRRVRQQNCHIGLAQ